MWLHINRLLFYYHTEIISGGYVFFCAWPPNNWIMWSVWGAVCVKTNNSVNVSFTRQCAVSWRQSCQAALVLRRQISAKANNFNRGDEFNWSDKFELVCQLRRRISAGLRTTYNIFISYFYPSRCIPWLALWPQLLAWQGTHCSTAPSKRYSVHITSLPMHQNS